MIKKEELERIEKMDKDELINEIFKTMKNIDKLDETIKRNHEEIQKDLTECSNALEELLK